LIITHVKALGGTECLAVVERFDRGENIDIAFNQLGNLDQDLAALKAGGVGSPCRVECDASGIERLVDIGLGTFDDGRDFFAVGRVDDTVRSGTRSCLCGEKGLLDSLAALRFNVFTVDPESGRDLDLALVGGVVEIVSV
jgi:hypothetical protein